MKKYRFRYDPVPGVGSWGKGSYYRNIKTTQQLRRRNHDIHDVRDEKYEYRIRRNYIPNLWDDLKKTNGRVKCWKHHTKRPKQYL